MNEKGRTCFDIFRVVLGPRAQFYPCEATEQKWDQKHCMQDTFARARFRLKS